MDVTVSPGLSSTLNAHLLRRAQAIATTVFYPQLSSFPVPALFPWLNHNGAGNTCRAEVANPSHSLSRFPRVSFLRHLRSGASLPCLMIHCSSHKHSCILSYSSPFYFFANLLPSLRCHDFDRLRGWFILDCGVASARFDLSLKPPSYLHS